MYILIRSRVLTELPGCPCLALHQSSRFRLWKSQDHSPMPLTSLATAFIRPLVVFVPRSPSEDLNIVLFYLSPQHQNTLTVFLHFYVSHITLHCIFTQAIELFISKMQQRRQEILDVCMPYLALCFLSVKPRREEQRHRCTIAALISHQGAQLSIKRVSLQFALVDV